MAKKSKYTIRKYDGDDAYSYSVFRAEDVKGVSSPVFYGRIKPIYSGLSMPEAQYYKRILEKGEYH